MYIYDEYTKDWNKISIKLEMTDGNFDCYYWRTDRIYCHQIVSIDKLQLHPINEINYC